MADRPIIFSAPMVRALIAGNKSQTRRLINPRGSAPSLFNGEWADSYILDPGNAEWRAKDVRFTDGDRLYVRENFYQFGGPIAYAADGLPEFPRKMTPCIHMPRWASRLTLLVDEVRVQRLHDITEADAIAEGVQRIFPAGSGSDTGPNHFTVSIDGGSLNAPTAAETFRMLWQMLHGEESWEANPFVVAVSFSVERANIDSIVTPARLNILTQTIAQSGVGV